MKKIKVMLDIGAYMPKRAHNTDAGYDLREKATNSEVVRSRSSVTIDTGVHIEIPEGYVGFLKSKSGLNVRHNITSEGVIDSGYTGSIIVKLYNHGDEDYIINPGDKITQLVLLPIITPEVEIVEEFKETERGDEGFGSTGK